jgi:hypothetical protein
MSEPSYPLAEYIKAGTEAIALIKTLYPLVPMQSRDEVEAKIAAAENALQKANVFLAQQWGYKLHDCIFPPQIILYDQNLKERVCPHCKFTTNFDRPLSPQDYEDEWVTARR